jgi:hypothetical protein
VENRQNLAAEQAQNSGASTHSVPQTNGNYDNLSFKRIADEQAQRLKKLVSDFCTILISL